MDQLSDKDRRERINQNVSELAELKRDNPLATHVYLRRPDGVLNDVPIRTAHSLLVTHPLWKLEGVAMKEVPQGKQNLHNPLENDVSSSEEVLTEISEEDNVPPKPSEENSVTIGDLSFKAAEYPKDMQYPRPSPADADDIQELQEDVKPKKKRGRPAKKTSKK